MEKFTARAQLIITLVTLLAFLAMAFLLIVQPVSLESSVQEFLEKILAALVIIVTQQSSYWFARQRPNNPQSAEPPLAEPPGAPPPMLTEVVPDPELTKLRAQRDLLVRELEMLESETGSRDRTAEEQASYQRLRVLLQGVDRDIDQHLIDGGPEKF